MQYCLPVFALALAVTVAIPSLSGTADACTGITLKAGDGAVLYGRTNEWGAFDLNSRVLIVPRKHAFIGGTPDGKPGKRWTAKYGVPGIDMLERGALADVRAELRLAHDEPSELRQPLVDVKRVSLAPTDAGITAFPLDRVRAEDIEDLTPKK